MCYSNILPSGLFVVVIVNICHTFCDCIVLFLSFQIFYFVEKTEADVVSLADVHHCLAHTLGELMRATHEKVDNFQLEIWKQERTLLENIPLSAKNEENPPEYFKIISTIHETSIKASQASNIKPGVLIKHRSIYRLMSVLNALSTGQFFEDITIKPVYMYFVSIAHHVKGYLRSAISSVQDLTSPTGNQVSSGPSLASLDPRKILLHVLDCLAEIRVFDSDETIRKGVINEMHAYRDALTKRELDNLHKLDDSLLQLYLIQIHYLSKRIATKDPIQDNILFYNGVASLMKLLYQLTTSRPIPADDNWQETEKYEFALIRLEFKNAVIDAIESLEFFVKTENTENTEGENGSPQN